MKFILALLLNTLTENSTSDRPDIFNNALFSVKSQTEAKVHKGRNLASALEEGRISPN